VLHQPVDWLWEQQVRTASGGDLDQLGGRQVLENMVLTNRGQDTLKFTRPFTDWSHWLLRGLTTHLSGLDVQGPKN
jgi:hypothetical protein